MHPFATVLTDLMDKRKLTTVDVAKVSNLTQPYISALRSGTRRVGPKSLAALFRQFVDVADQRLLAAAFLTESLAEVQAHTGEAADATKPGHKFEGLISSSTLGRKSGITTKVGPRWLDELLEEAVQQGDSEEEILSLIKSLFGAVMQHRRQHRPKKR